MVKRYSGDAAIDGLLSDAGLSTPAVNSWSPASVVGQGVQLTYDWMTQAPQSPPAGGFQAFSATQRQGALDAMALVSEVANVSFTRQASGTADIEFGTVSFGGGSQSYTAGLARTWWTITPSTTYYTRAEVYLTNSFPALQDMSRGSFSFSTMLHELGHALGLDHSFENRPTPAHMESEQYTVMSYTRHPDMYVEPASFLLNDIAALQYLYGANTSTRTGNTTYSWGNNEAFIEAVWDAGGTDTIDASNQSRSVQIDLNAGAFSSIGTNGSGGAAKNNLAIAHGATIENANGGTGSDTLSGNNAKNVLKGGAGSDKIFGHGGNDWVSDGSGNDDVQLGASNDYVRVNGGRDKYDGGTGKDYISYYDSGGGVTLDLEANTASGSWAGNDTISNFESAAGSRVGKDTIYGTSEANTIRTYGGNDKAFDRLGNDFVELGDGHDYVRVGGGVDHFNGGVGKDYISYYDSTGGVTVDLASNQTSRSWAGNDTISNFESVAGSRVGGDVLKGTSTSNTLRGYGGNDRLDGGDGNDILYGASGADQLKGGAGNDFLDSGAGAALDQLFGGSGADRFHFDRREGNDVAMDFENNIDTIEFDNFSYLSDAASALAFASTQGNDVLFDFGADGTLLVENVTMAQLTNDIDIV